MSCISAPDGLIRTGRDHGNETKDETAIQLRLDRDLPLEEFDMVISILLPVQTVFSKSIHNLITTYHYTIKESNYYFGREKLNNENITLHW